MVPSFRSLIFLGPCLIGLATAQSDEQLAALKRASRYSDQIAQQFNASDHAGNYAAVYELLRDVDQLPAGVEQMAATWLTFVGAQQLAQVVWDREAPGHPETNVTLPPDGKMVDAVGWIADAAQQHQIVMINEAHHIPQHREFTKQLLAPLYDQGFRYLALEALANQEEFYYDGHPYEETRHATFEHGFYCVEPAFGDLIRTALKLGFALVPYEMRATDTEGAPGIERREIAQCNYLLRFLDENPEEKLLVHLGYAHLYEVPYGGNQWMACRLKQATGLDPLTIDQSRMTQTSRLELDPAPLLAALAQYSFSQPSILLLDDDQPWTQAEPEGLYDVNVFHPRFEYEHDRPTWLRDSPLRHPFHVLDAPRPEPESWVLLQALVADEDRSKSIPMDQFPWHANNENPVLYLPPGNYHLRTVDKNGDILWQQQAEWQPHEETSDS